MRRTRWTDTSFIVTELQGPVLQIFPVRTYDARTHSLNVVLDGRQVGILRLDKALYWYYSVSGFDSHRGRHPTELPKLPAVC